MRRAERPVEHPIDPEIERTCRNNRREARRQLFHTRTNMENQQIVDPNANLQGNGANQADRILRDYDNPASGNFNPPIARSEITEGNFELKPIMFQMIHTNGQFSGAATDDLHDHIKNFLVVCNSFHRANVTPDTVKLALSPYSVIGGAKVWLNSQPAGSITTWEDLLEKFMTRYFPPQKTMRLRNMIHNFRQMDGESLYETWERFKELIRSCPNHSIADHVQIETFYNGCDPNSRILLDFSASGVLLNKTYMQAYDLIETISRNSLSWPTERYTPLKKAEAQSSNEPSDRDVLRQLVTQVGALAQVVNKMQLKPKFGNNCSRDNRGDRSSFLCWLWRESSVCHMFDQP